MREGRDQDRDGGGGTMHNQRLSSSGIYKAIFSFSVLNFLFNGFYKKSFPIAVDWTLVWFAVSGILLLVGSRWDLKFAWKQRALHIFALLVAYLSWRVPDLSLGTFGTQKVLEAIFLGIPAFIFGMWIGLSGGRFRGLSWLMAWGSSLISLLVTVSAILIGNVSSSNSFLDAGYQLTGAFVSAALIMSCTLLDRPQWRIIIALIGCQILGLAFIGSIPSFVSSLALMLVSLFALRKKKHDLIHVRRIFQSLALGWLLILIFSILFGLPAALYRVAWKIDVNLSRFSLYSDEIAPGGAITLFGKEIVKLHPSEERANYVDRSELYSAALAKFRQAPILGVGFGIFNYKGYRAPHNIFLELAVEAGVLAVLLFCLFLCAVYCSVIEAGREIDSRKDLLMLVAVLALAAHVLLLQMVGGYFIGRIQMFFFGLAIGVSILTERNSMRAGGNHL